MLHRHFSFVSERVCAQQVAHSRLYQITLDANGKPRYTIHQLRHTVGTAFIREYPEHIVSRMLGHRDPRSTRRYAEVTEDQVRAVLAAHRRR
jgi:site-specific recombinase XerD